MSKLGPHFLQNTPQAEQWQVANIAKFYGTWGAAEQFPDDTLKVGTHIQHSPTAKDLYNAGWAARDAAQYTYQINSSIYESNPTIEVWEFANELVFDSPEGWQWYGDYSVEYLKMLEGICRKGAVFSFAVGTPERDDWFYLLDALRYVQENDHYLAVHEYGAAEFDLGVGWKQVVGGEIVDYIWHGNKEQTYPYGWGVLRYRYIYETVLKPNGIVPNLLITETGCDLLSFVPNGWPNGAWKDLFDWWETQGYDPERHYADMLIWYDEKLKEDSYVKGATIFTVGSTGIWASWDIGSTKTVDYLTDYIANDDPTPPKPEEPLFNYKSIPVLLPQDATLEERQQVTTETFANRRTITQSHDEVIGLVSNAKTGSYAIIYDLHRWPQENQNQLLSIPHELRTLTEPPTTRKFDYWPVLQTRITQRFGQNPEYYSRFGLPGHEGLDIAVPLGEPYFAVEQGTVVHASNRKWSSNELSNYGYHIVIDHGDYKTVYAHARNDLQVSVGQQVNGGQIIAYSGDTGNSTGPHIHFGVLSPTDTGNGYPIWRYGQPVDPFPFIKDLPLPETPTQQINLLNFMRADPTAWRTVRHPNGSQEDFREYWYPNENRWAMVKNSLAEFWEFDNNYIYLKKDTSPAPDSQGNDRLYIVEPGKYAKRYMSIGETYNDGGHYVQFYRKSDCQPLSENSGHSGNNTTVLRLEENYTFNTYGQNLTLDEVLFIQGNTEIQVFARHNGKSLGRVAWMSSWGNSEIVELYFDRGELTEPPEEYCYS